MTTLKFRLTNIALAAAALGAIGFGAMNAGSASAAQTDGPWPEPPSCDNNTGSCTSLADQLAYECFFEESDFPIKWCDTELPVEMRETINSFKAELPAPPPPPVTNLAVRR